jgi:hypothetical protein
MSCDEKKKELETLGGKMCHMNCQVGELKRPQTYKTFVSNLIGGSYNFERVDPEMKPEFDEYCRKFRQRQEEDLPILREDIKKCEIRCQQLRKEIADHELAMEQAAGSTE